MTPPIEVVAAVARRDGRLLITRRQAGVHLEGYWEFPGGKVDEGETHAEALEREMREELGVDTLTGALLLETTHHYPEKSVTLFFYDSTLLGEPRPLLDQEMRWVQPEELTTLPFPPADEALIALLSGSAAN